MKMCVEYCQVKDPMELIFFRVIVLEYTLNSSETFTLCYH